MAYSLHELQKLFLIPTLSESELVKKLKIISQNFTIKREHIKDYVLDEKFVSAYSAFYLPTNYPKFSFLMNSLSLEFREKIKDYDFYDIGSGPGTYSLAFLDYLNGDYERNVFVIDSSSLMLKQAKNILGHYHRDKKIHYGTAIEPSQRKKIFFFGNSINEIGRAGLKNLINTHSPDIVMFIEPGTSDFFKEALGIREMLIDKKFSILYPCINASACPIAKIIDSGGVEWCHQVLRMTHEPSIERLSQLIELDRKIMPMIAHVYSMEKSHVNKIVHGRLFRFLNETKFSFEWQVCFGENEENKLAKFEIQKRSLSKSDQKEMKKLSVGIGFNFEIEKELGPNHFRVKLID